MESSDQTWLAPQYDISKPPSLESTLKISRDTRLVGNFPRVAKWCPDGSVVLAQCENRSFQLFDMTSQGDTAGQNFAPTQEFPQAAPVLDFVWYPTATPQNPATFCFIASVRECPVKLLDASDGRLRASYRIVDHRERQIAPNSLAFNLTAQKLYCGFEDAIEVFDISRPGDGTRIPTTPSKKSKDGLKGIISSLAFSPSYSPEECFFAAGSFSPTSGNIAMFSDAGSEPVMFINGGPQAGVTQLQFNPVKPHILYAAYRGSASGSVYSWDIRSNVDVPLEIFQSVSSVGSDCRTNQRIRFDIDLAGHLLSIGDQLGNISIFDLDGTADSNEGGASLHHLPLERSYDAKISYPNIQFKAHDDVVGSVGFHPFMSTLLSTSGSRHFNEDSEPKSDSDSDSSWSKESDISRHPDRKSGSIRRRRRPQPVTLDSTIKIWDLK